MRGKQEFDRQNEYNREKYDRVGLMLPKGTAGVWREEAKARGLSLNAFVLECVKLRLENWSNEEKTDQN